MEDWLKERQYNGAMAMFLYKKAHEMNYEDFEKEFIDEKLVDLDRIYKLIRLHSADVDGKIIYYVRSVLDLVNDMHGKELYISTDYKLTLGDTYNADYIYELESLMIPNIMRKNDFDKFLKYFKKVVHRLVFKAKNIEDNIDDSKLHNLAQVARNIREIHIYNYNTWGLLVQIIIAHIYCFDGDYNLVNNFLNNPRYYYEKLINDGYAEYNREDDYAYVPEKYQKMIFDDASRIFTSCDKRIK